MKIETLKKPYSICLDWLELIVTGKISVLETDIRMGSVQENYIFSERFSLSKTNGHKRIGFKFCFSIYLDNNNIGYLFYGNNGKLRFANPDSILIHIENHVLYQTDLAEKLYFILNTLQLSFSHYFRIDIALDGSGLIAQFNTLTNSKKYFRKRKIFQSGIIDEQTKLHSSFILGSRNSEKYISIYDKTEEMEKSGKPYIKDFWQKNNLDTSKNVDRMELRLKTKALKSFSVNFTCLENPSYLASFFNSIAGNFLEFFNSNNTSKSLIDWSYFEKIKINKLPQTQKAFSLRSRQTGIKMLYEEFVKTDDKEIASVLKKISASYNLNSWVVKSIPKWDYKLKQENILHKKFNPSFFTLK